ncbi:predicted protein [Uncinocarpus reesii 1704]|uniref:Alpha/gamma-adaptin-binding protein p34 n=1 Tax=Uncinocarpus reesii (strain UAMH 1704) TaxID=336963 RepID=C4JQH2_UNCRE|nr:uncharacterized protein UREG_03317 [Uncinocarpus reesii 1704]EEP78471.1 predicted protein [Uncinocarpus reesii 1704]
MSSTPTQATAPGQKNGARISNPKRLLILTPHTHSENTVPPFLHRLTGTPISPHLPTEPPSKDDGSPESQNQPAGTFAGYTTHAPLQLSTKYYTADIPIWVDEIPMAASALPLSSNSQPKAEQEHTTPSAWSTTFLAPQAAEVRSAIGAMLILLQKPVTVSPAIPAGEAIEERGRVCEAAAALKTVIEEERGEGGTGEVPALLVLVGSGDKEVRKILGEDFEGGYGGAGEEMGLGEGDEYGVRWWDEELAAMGIYDFEVVGWDLAVAEAEQEKRRNEFGELEGMPRIREVLEANEWTMFASHEDLANPASGSLDDFAEEGLDIEVGELEREMFGLRMAIEKGEGDGTEGEEDDFDEDDLAVEQLEGLMLRVQAIRDMGADLPESERKRFASKAIRDIMKDL